LFFLLFLEIVWPDRSGFHVWIIQQTGLVFNRFMFLRGFFNKWNKSGGRFLDIMTTCNRDRNWQFRGVALTWGRDEIRDMRCPLGG
jgi:hypothetical protein